MSSSAKWQADLVSGGAGNDTIVGGTGHDQLTAAAAAMCSPTAMPISAAQPAGWAITATARSDYGTGDSFNLTGVISHADLVLAGGEFEDVVRVIDGGNGNVVVEINEAAALHNSADADWSAAFTVYDTTVDQLRFTFDGHDWTYDSGTQQFEIVP